MAKALTESKIIKQLLAIGVKPVWFKETLGISGSELDHLAHSDEIAHQSWQSLYSGLMSAKNAAQITFRDASLESGRYLRFRNESDLHFVLPNLYPLPLSAYDKLLADFVDLTMMKAGTKFMPLYVIFDMQEFEEAFEGGTDLEADEALKLFLQRELTSLHP